MTDMIEPVARAMAPEVWETSYPWQDKDKEFWLGRAIAAIKAMREPTKIMIDAVREIGGPQAAAYAIAAWPTMIDASLGENK